MSSSAATSRSDRRRGRSPRLTAGTHRPTSTATTTHRARCAGREWAPPHAPSCSRCSTSTERLRHAAHRGGGPAIGACGSATTCSGGGAPSADTGCRVRTGPRYADRDERAVLVFDRPAARRVRPATPSRRAGVGGLHAGRPLNPSPCGEPLRIVPGMWLRDYRGSPTGSAVSGDEFTVVARSCSASTASATAGGTRRSSWSSPARPTCAQFDGGAARRRDAATVIVLRAGRQRDATRARCR